MTISLSFIADQIIADRSISPDALNERCTIESDSDIDYCTTAADYLAALDDEAISDAERAYLYADNIDCAIYSFAQMLALETYPRADAQTLADLLYIKLEDAQS